MSNDTKDIYYYQPSSVTELSSSLAKALEGMEIDGNRYIKSATVNTLLAVSASYNKQEIEDLIFTLSLVHPNRAFLVVIDESAKELKAEFSTRCHKISQNEHVCSEVIRMTASPAQLQDVKSVLRANLLTGINTELILCQEESAASTFNQFSELSEQIIFSATIFEKNFQSLKNLLDSPRLLIDLSWVSLGAWRDQVKEIFDVPMHREFLSQLSTVDIVSADGISGCKLLAGWLADRLGMQLKKGSSANYALISSQGKEIKLNIKSKGENSSQGLEELTFTFNDPKKFIKIKRAELLETEISLEENRKITRPIDNLNFEGLLKRYFFIGESTMNYRNSLANALKLDSLG